MTEGGKASNNSSEEAELEKPEAKCKDNEKKTAGQVDDMLECSLCQVIDDSATHV